MTTYACLEDLYEKANELIFDQRAVYDSLVQKINLDCYSDSRLIVTTRNLQQDLHDNTAMMANYLESIYYIIDGIDGEYADDAGKAALVMVANAAKDGEIAAKMIDDAISEYVIIEANLMRTTWEIAVSMVVGELVEQIDMTVD